MSRRPSTLFLVAIAALLGWLSIPGALRFGADPSVADLAAVVLATPEGGRVGLGALAGGKPLVVNLWASWCAPCRRELPLLAAAQKESAGQTRFVFANQGEDVFTAEQYLAATGLNVDNAVLDASRALGQRFGSSALPVTLFFDAGGRLVASHIGELSPDSLSRNLGKTGGRTPASRGPPAETATTR